VLSRLALPLAFAVELLAHGFGKFFLKRVAVSTEYTSSHEYLI
jgi:uncharacterized membrane protein YphA (DoxX/SURF4 family)